MNNPPAFPRSFANEHLGLNSATQQGMTLHDYFAAKAMQGILSNPEFKGMGAGAVAEESFLTADAMMKARRQ